MTLTLRRGLPLIAACLVAAVLCGCGGASHPRGRSASSSTSSAATSVTQTTVTGAATTTPTTTAGATGAVTYGIGDAQGEFAGCEPIDPDCCNPSTSRCERSAMQGYFDNPLFLRLSDSASAHRVRDVRLFVAYDAVEQWNGSTSSPGCTYSQVLTHSYDDLANGVQSAGESINDLIAGVIEARSDGLTPVVSIAGYPFAAARPPWDQPITDPTTIGGYWEYRCGVQGILGAVNRLPAWERPHIWEALNEPEGFSIFRGSGAATASSCDVGATPQPDGPAKAACDEVIASRTIHRFAGHAGDTVIAGTFKHPYASYLAPYAAELAMKMPGASFPSTWSVHDYGEVTDAYQGVGVTDLTDFDVALARDSAGRARSLWITEAGTVLTSDVHGGDCPAVGVDPAGTLGACVNGQVVRQAQSVAAFFALPKAGSAVPITHLFWYQFVGAAKWDSGLLDAAGAPRPAYCAFYGSGTCAGSPDAAS